MLLVLTRLFPDLKDGVLYVSLRQEDFGIISLVYLSPSHNRQEDVYRSGEYSGYEDDAFPRCTSARRNSIAVHMHTTHARVDVRGMNCAREVMAGLCSTPMRIPPVFDAFCLKHVERDVTPFYHGLV
jgi:hypothetical protein